MRFKYGRFFFLAWAFIVVIAWTVCSAQADMKEALALNKEGETLLEKSNFRQAALTFDRMRQACSGDAYCEAVADFYLARTHLELSDLNTATNMINRAQSVFQSLNRNVERGKALHVQGRILAAQSKYDSAIKCYDQAFDLVGKNTSTDSNELFSILINKTDSLIQLTRLESALNVIGQASGFAPRGDRLSQAMVKERQGAILVQQCNYREALDNLNSALKYYETNPNSSRQASLLNNVGHIHESWSEYSKALDYYRKALQLSIESGSQILTGIIYNNIGNVDWKLGDYSSAERNYKSSLEILDARGVEGTSGQVRGNLGAVYLAYGDYDRALGLYDESYSRALKMGSKLNQAWALHGKAWVLKDKGEFAQARKNSGLAIELARQSQNSKLEALATLRLGNLYEYYGDYDEALTCYGKASTIQEEIGDSLSLSHNLADSGNLLARDALDSFGSLSPKESMALLDEADAKFRKSLELKKKIGSPTTDTDLKYSVFSLQKSKLFSREDNLGMARASLEAARRSLNPVAVDDALMFSFVEGLLTLESDPGKSVRAFQDLNSRSKSLNRTKFQFLSSFGLGQAYERSKEWNKAEKAYTDAVRLAESIRDTLEPQDKTRFLDGEQVLGVKHVLPYEGLARVRLMLGDHQKSFQASEYTKARSFADRLSQRVEGRSFGVDESLLVELESIEKSIQKTMSRFHAAMTSDSGSESTAHQLEKKITDEKRRQIEVSERIRDHNHKFYDLKFPALDRTRPINLTDNETALVFEVTDSGLIIYLLNGSKVENSWIKQVSRAELEALTMKFRLPFEKVAERGMIVCSEAFDLEAARKLYKILFEGPDAALKTGQLIRIVPDECLTSVPFEAIVVNYSGQISQKRGRCVFPQVEFLGDKYRIVYYQSLTALSLLRAGQTKSSNLDKTLLVANPDYGGFDAMAQFENGVCCNWPPLNETERLVMSFNDMFGGKTESYVREEASLDVFRSIISPKLNQFDFLVFATHGYLGKTCKSLLEPALVMAGAQSDLSAYLRMSEIMNVRMNADLAALVACQSGLGKRISGEGAMSMGTAFQYAGARSVLASLWSVEVGASVKLIEDFVYFWKKEGQTKAEALFQARKRLREFDNRLYENPFFWSAFILVGDQD